MIACQDSNTLPSLRGAAATRSVDGKSCMVLSQTSLRLSTLPTRNMRQARDAAMKLTKLPTTIRGMDSKPCCQPYSTVVK
ncbi:hypothetical protein D3C87_1595830 [compost metagenome]